MCCFSAQAADHVGLVFPADAGALNVRDYGALGDGIHDDTAAFIAALDQSSDSHTEHWHIRIVQVPPGNYRVTDTITKRFPDGSYNAGLILVGAGENRTRISLAEGSGGFQDPAHPKAVIYTTGKGFAQSPKNGYALWGDGNDGFSNFVENLTIDVGQTNPGAIGIDYLANNQGAIRSVTVTGAGRTGIAITRPWTGPALLEHVTVEGFDYGIDIASINYSVTIDDLSLIGQHRIALRNADNLVSAHNLRIQTLGDPDVQAIANTTTSGMIVVDGGTLDGAGGSPVGNTGMMDLRDLKLVGFDLCLGYPVRAAGDMVAGVFQGSARLAVAAQRWTLKGKNAPAVPTDPVWKWASAVAFGAVGDGLTDSTAALQAALASGARTIYLPFGVYVVRGNLDLPATVRRIVGMNSTILWTPPDNFDLSVDDPAKGFLRTGNADGPVLIEKLYFSCPSPDFVNGHHTAIEAVGPATLILRDIVGMGTAFQRDSGGGPLFLENVSGGFLLRIAGAAPVWGRQIDTEGGGVRGGVGNVRIANDGAPLWLLGLKSEGNNTLVANSDDATTDIVGTLFAPLVGVNLPLFTSVNARLQATGLEVAFNATASYAIILTAVSSTAVFSVSADSQIPRPATTGVFLARLAAEP